MLCFFGLALRTAAKVGGAEEVSGGCIPSPGRDGRRFKSWACSANLRRRRALRAQQPNSRESVDAHTFRISIRDRASGTITFPIAKRMTINRKPQQPPSQE